MNTWIYILISIVVTMLISRKVIILKGYGNDKITQPSKLTIWHVIFMLSLFAGVWVIVIMMVFSVVKFLGL